MKITHRVPVVVSCVAMLAIGLTALIGCDKASTDSASTTTAAKPSEDGRCPHEIRTEKCPFCTPALIESDGFCGEHGVAEALCYKCRPYLKTAFRAKGDWCKEHEAPDSQCWTCHPELAEKATPGSGHGAGH